MDFKLRILNGHALTPILADSLAQVGDHYGHKMNHYHRADLHRTLRELAQDTTYSPETPVTIRLGTELVEIDCEKATLTLEDGTRTQKDLLVIADGIKVGSILTLICIPSFPVQLINELHKSRFVAQITGKDEPMINTGKSAYRCLIPFLDILQDEETRGLFENEPPGFCMPFSTEPHIYCIMCSCRKLVVILRTQGIAADNVGHRIVESCSTLL